MTKRNRNVLSKLNLTPGNENLLTNGCTVVYSYDPFIAFFLSVLRFAIC